eukprot:SAG31_NODE_4731_length_2995_cov_3.155732_2_plen_362_part_00
MCALQLVAPTTTGLYEYEWRMRPVVPSGLPQFWDVTVVLAVVSDPAMFDPVRTILTISVPSVTATQPFDILANVRDRYGNDITASGIPAFGIALSRTSMQSTTSGDSQFFVAFDATLGYTFRDVVADVNGTHGVRELIGLPNSIHDATNVALAEPLTFDVNPLPCDPPETYASSYGDQCLKAYCERGYEVSADLTLCEQYDPGTYLDDGGGHGRQCEQCGEASICSERACTACAQCPAGRTPNALRTECMSCPPGSAGVSGICTQCSGGIPNDGQTACVRCPAGQRLKDGSCQDCAIALGLVPNDVGDDCICRPDSAHGELDGFYNTSLWGPIRCYRGEYVPPNTPSRACLPCVDLSDYRG